VDPVRRPVTGQDGNLCGKVAACFRRTQMEREREIERERASFLSW
jgi:hypothetical protein